jgi:hypothetical protein
MSNSNTSETKRAVVSAPSKATPVEPVSKEVLKDVIANGRHAVTVADEKKSKPAKSDKPKTVQEAVFQIIGKNRNIEIHELEEKGQKLLPRGKGRYLQCRLEFMTLKSKVGDVEKEFVYPQISDHGAELIAKYIAKRGIDHWWTRKASKEILLAGQKLVASKDLSPAEYKVLKEILAPEESKPAENKTPTEQKASPTVKA